MTERDPHEDIGAAVRAAAGSVRAPERLHEQVAARRPARRARAIPLAVAAAAACALAAALVLSAGAGPSVQAVAAAALQVPTQPAPATDTRDRRFIAAEVGGVRFPDYEERWGWKAIGARTDEVAGRHALTVIYRKGELGVHYTIVDGDPLPVPDGARRFDADGVPVWVVRDGDALLAIWRRGGRSCVLASRIAGAEQLVALAAWR